MLVGMLEERGHLEYVVVNWIIILKLIFVKCDDGHGPHRSGLGLGQVTGSCECGNEPSSYLK